MLSDSSKAALKGFIYLAKQKGLDDKAREIGPVKVLDVIIDANSDMHPEIDRNIIDNRHEAEQFVGGLMGMC